MRKEILYVFIFFLTISCKTSKLTTNDIYGLYEIKNSNANGEILINKDNTFEYNYSIGLLKTESKGVWKISNNYIILTSNKEYLSNTIVVDEFNGLENKSIYIKDSNGIDCLNAFVQFNDEEDAYEVDEFGRLLTLPNKKINSFKIHYLGEIYEYMVKNKESNNFNVIVYLANLSKTYFDKEFVRYKNQSLIIDNLIFLKKEELMHEVIHSIKQ